MKLKTLTSATAAAAVAASLVVAPAAPAHHSPVKKCRDVAFTPGSDDMAASIRARGVSCSFARDFIRDSDGRPGTRYGGFRCQSRFVDSTESLPHTRVRCTSRDQGMAMSWKRY